MPEAELNPYSEITFPVYRRYRNGLSWFRIDSPQSFEEIRIMGTQFIRSQHDVKILPDRNMVYDLVFMQGDNAEPITAAEYESLAQKAR